MEIEKETTEVVDEKNQDVVEIREDTFDGKVSDVAAEAIVVIGDLIDEVCSEEEYSLNCKGIPQVDGTFDEEVEFTFVSDFHKVDIEYTVQELIPKITERNTSDTVFY